MTIDRMAHALKTTIEIVAISAWRLQPWLVVLALKTDRSWVEASGMGSGHWSPSRSRSGTAYAGRSGRFTNNGN